MKTKMQRFETTRRKFLKNTLAYSAFAAFAPLSCKSMLVNKPVLRFGMVTDSHYADRDPSPTRFYRQSIPKMEECVDLMNAEKVDFLIHLGDFKDQDVVPKEANTLKYLKKQEGVFAQFNGSKYHVLGNHDMDSISKQQFLKSVENTGIDQLSSFYSFDQKGVHFIVLDANFRKDGIPYENGNFEWTESFIPPEQLQWLEKDLKATEKLTIVFVHQLLDHLNDDHYTIFNADAVRTIFKKSNKVLCVFQGHIHKEKYHRIDNIHYYTLNAMVDHSGKENNSYAIVDVYRNGDLMVNGYRRAGSDRMGQVRV